MNTNEEQNFSIIIPTYQEAQNIPELARRISLVDFGDKKFEVILVDDNSNDGIVNVVQELTHQYPWLKLIVRRDKKCLSQSIITGYKNARYPIMITMDADLSHPPEKIPAFLAAISDPKIDYVLGSRYIPGGSCDDIWPMTRKITSRAGAIIANLLIFTGNRIKDPLSGFSAIKRKTFLAADRLEPIGWKIGLEIMIKCHCKNIVEIPIHFSQRNKGYSKLNLKIALSYLLHVNKLFWYKILAY